MIDPANRKIKVLQVVEACGAGVGRHVRNLCEDLIARGHLVTVAYSPGRMDEAFWRFVSERRHEIPFIPLMIGREVSPFSDLRGIVKLVHMIRREEPFDVIHGHSSKGGAIGRITGRAMAIPTVYTPHGLIVSSPEIPGAEAAVYTLIERALGHWATSKFITVSEDERELVIKLKLAPADRIAIIENAINDQDFSYLSEEVTLEDVRRKPLTFGSTMRFSAQKAPYHLIDAFIRLSRTLPQVPMRLVIAGDGELFAKARRQAEVSGLGEKISLLGWRTDTKELLHGFDIFVISSLYEAGLSYSTMEAMAARLPIVSTDVFGTKKMISKIPGNILVPAGDPAALADGMKRMATLTDDGLLRRSLRKIGQANHDYVRAHFRQSEITRRTLEVYRALC